MTNQFTRRNFINTLCAAAAAGTTPLTARAAAPLLEKNNLFEAGIGGYALYRIPGLLVTPKGSVLAWCEARKRPASDWGTIDIQLRRSIDGGKTFDQPRIIANVAGPKRKNPAAVAQQLGTDDEVTYNNPVLIADRKIGAIHFLFCLEYMRCFYARSDDDGQTFSQPREITATFEGFRADYNWKVIATGPGHSIQLKSGRLLVPVWMSDGTGGHAHRPSVIATIYSDDAGRTWQRGEIAVPNTTEYVYPSESVAAQLTDGRVLLNARTESKPHRRFVTYSKDGARGWTKPVTHEELLEPICMASLIRLSDKPARLLFVNPNNLTRANGKEEPGKSRDRRNVSVKLSYDEGRTWPVTKALEPGPSGYSDLAVGNDGTIFCLYENGTKDGSNLYSAQLTLARFNLEWLTDGNDALKKK